MTFRACSSASGLLSAFAILSSSFCTSGFLAAAMASNVMSVSFCVVMLVSGDRFGDRGDKPGDMIGDKFGDNQGYR